MTTFPMTSGCTIADFDPSVVADELLASLDIAAVNLACAKGLPGAEALDIPACLAKIDEWSEKVREATSRNFDKFKDEPRLFGGSLGKFYMTVLCTTLERECGVQYNPARANDPGDARNAGDRFIHGITHGAGGTCASLPVLYAAVGRRLGYPLRIVQGARHLFLRWDESDVESPLARDRFNIEATARGFVSHPDRFYEQWPFPHPDPDVDPRYYLRSLTPREELAIFLCIRSIVLMDNGKFVEAIQPAAWARQLAPDDYSIKVHLEMTMLLALGILDEKPAWMDAHPVIRPDGVAWSRYWWPRPMENRELLPAARLPRHILARILPPDSPQMEFGDMADPLYERASQYADEEFIAHVHQTAIAEQSTAEALFHNALVRARQRAMIEETSRLNQLDLARQQAVWREMSQAKPRPGAQGPHAQPWVDPTVTPGCTFPPQPWQPTPNGGRAAMMAPAMMGPAGLDPFGMPRFGPAGPSNPGIPAIPPAPPSSAAHDLMLFAATRRPNSGGGSTVSHQQRLG
ncbi:MAG TPA: hypothetical protein VFI31_04945 [Pirellulales bacterium]|nr:hypothetical protein [Pirellulales bacterium]